MIGFLPGFAYLAPVDERIAMPRRATPRVRVPAGSVGIAGRQTGIYPMESPGGWQILGRTAIRMFDPERTPAALVAPGDIVQFVVEPGGSHAGGSKDPPLRTAKVGGGGLVRRGGSLDPPAGDPSLDPPAVVRTLTVLRPGLSTTVQDMGRWGHQASGVPVSGAMDLVAHRIANALVGNDADAATLEVTLAGPELRIDHPATIVVAGADLSATLDGAALPLETATRCRGGSVLRFGDRRSGARAYVAVDGGIAVPLVLGSRATHVRCRMGGLEGRALRAGDTLPLGPPAVGPASRRRKPEPPVSRTARLRFVIGPQADRYPDHVLNAVEQTPFTIAPESDRTGYRLHLERATPVAAAGEMISDATFAGAIQVPPSGQPILLMADRQTTGGYPQIGVVIAADLPKAAQLAPGDRVVFERCSRAEAMAALVEQESRLLALA
jgi:biotin-dependent carboxylase-like uncharacterized protein